MATPSTTVVRARPGTVLTLWTPEDKKFWEQQGEAIARIKASGLRYHADPNGSLPGEIYHNRAGGRGVYFPDPDGHFLEIITRPYGSGG